MPILQTTEIFRRSKAVVVEAICCDFFPQILLAPVFKKELQIYSLKKKKTTHLTTQNVNITTFRGAQETTMKTIHKNHTTTRRLQYIAACAGIVSCCPWFNRLGKKKQRGPQPTPFPGSPSHPSPKKAPWCLSGCVFFERKEIEIRDFGGNFRF